MLLHRTYYPPARRAVFARSCAMHTIARNAFKIESIICVITYRCPMNARTAIKTQQPLFLRFCRLSSAAISVVGGFLFYPHNRLYRTRHSVCREDVDTEIQHCYSSSFSFAFLTISIFYQKRCPIKRTLVMTSSSHYSEIRRWRVKSDFVR